MSNRFKPWFHAIAIVIFAMALIELAARSTTVSNYIAARPAIVISPTGYAARLRAFEAGSEPKIAIVGTSVALGQAMENHGVPDWREHELTDALAARSVNGQTIVNMAANGATPADIAETINDVSQRGASAVIVVVGLRGFSSDFEREGAVHSAPWKTSSSPRDLWQTRAVFTHVVEDRLGLPLSKALTVLRNASKPTLKLNSQQAGLLALKLRRRLMTSDPDPAKRDQAMALKTAISIAVENGTKVLVVYATENPQKRRQMMPASLRTRKLAALKLLVHDAGGTFMGPDETMSAALFLDEAHPNPKGYDWMANRIVSENRAVFGLSSL